MDDQPPIGGQSLESLTKTVPLASSIFATLSPAQAEEFKHLAALFEELDREFGESDDPDLRFAAAFARQCALGDLASQSEIDAGMKFFH
jgi:hypothetical protein